MINNITKPRAAILAGSIMNSPCPKPERILRMNEEKRLLNSIIKGSVLFEAVLGKF